MFPNIGVHQFIYVDMWLHIYLHTKLPIKKVKQGWDEMMKIWGGQIAPGRCHDLMNMKIFGKPCLCEMEVVFLLHVLKLGGGFKYFLFSPLFGEDSHFD